MSRTNRKYENIWFLYNRRRFFYEFSRSILTSEYHIWYNYFFIINTVIFFYFRNTVSDVFKHFIKSKSTKFIQSHLKIHRIRRCSWLQERSRCNSLDLIRKNSFCYRKKFFFRYVEILTTDLTEMMIFFLDVLFFWYEHSI